MSKYVIKMAQVESIEDEADGMRIKARLEQDGKRPTSELPYSFPLLPKTIQSMPKVGENVLIFTSELGNNGSNRFYIGPVISQPQKQEYDPYSYGRGTSVSLLQGNSYEPLERISNFSITKGSFPNKNDIALVGRKSEDIILKDGELVLRCGIRGKAYGNENIVGNVAFNNDNPAYIQMKYSSGIGHSQTQEADSVINLVSDKINLISHKGNIDETLTDSEELIKSGELDSIMKQLHKLPYGDLLVEALEIIRKSILVHVHAYPGLPPCNSYEVNELKEIDFNEILSDNVRIN